MDNARRIGGATMGSLLLGSLLVVAGIVMIVLGWPEQAAWQGVLMDLSGVMFALAVAVAIWRMVSERDLMRHPTPRFRIVRWITVLGVAAGALLYVIAFATRSYDLAPLAQFFVWIGLGAMFAHLAAGAIRRELIDRADWEVREDRLQGLLDDGEPVSAPRPGTED